MFADVVEVLIVAVPPPTPVTGTVAVVAPDANDTAAGTVTTPVLGVALIFTVRPLGGAGPDRVRVRFWVATPEIVAVNGLKVSVAVPCTIWPVDP
jgi:hypothetical protein